MYFSDSNGHVGLGSQVVDTQKCKNATFTLTLLETERKKQFVLHAMPSGVFSTDGRFTAAQFLSWLGFSRFDKCQHNQGPCYYKIIGDLETGFPSTATQIQQNEIRRELAKKWAGHFDTLLTQVQNLQIALRDIGVNLPGQK